MKIEVCSVDQFDEINRDLGYDIQYLQLSRKPFRATMEFEERDGWLVSRECMTGPVEVRCAESEGWCSIVSPSGVREVLVNGVRADDGLAFLLAPGHENRMFTSGHVDVRTLRIPLSALEGVARDFGIDWSGGMLCGVNAISRGPQVLRRFASAIDSVLDPASDGSHPDLSGWLVLEGLLPAILESRTASAELSPSKGDATFTQVLSFIDAKLPDEITLEDLSGELQMSVRSVQRLFSNMLGVTPTLYIESRRLNMVRRLLLTADRSSTKVSDIALAMGFRHLGRFATTYHARFGECARDTLSRSCA